MLDPSFKPTEVPGLPLKLVHRRVQHRVAATAEFLHQRVKEQTASRSLEQGSCHLVTP